MTSSDQNDTPADDVNIPDQLTVEDFPVYSSQNVPPSETDNVEPGITLNDIAARLDQLEAASNATFGVIGQISAQVNWIGQTINNMLTSAASMGGPGGKVMSLLLGGGKK